MKLDSYDTPEAEALLRAGDAREARAPQRAEQLSELVAGVGFLAAALALAILAPWPRHLSVPVMAVIVVTYLLVSRVGFVVGDGYTLPTQMVLVPMLFLLPTPLVPITVGCLAVIARLAECVASGSPKRRAGQAFGDAWHALGPALVLVLTSSERFSWTQWPIYLGALAAQGTFDALAACARGWFSERIRPAVQLGLYLWIFAVDVELSAIGVLIAAASVHNAALVLLALPVAHMLSIFARERRQRLEHFRALGSAYRGTALLLGDVVEADDAYTGSHSRGVLQLSLAVADALGLDPAARRQVELGALLHDVGKVRVPKEILHKPGPLDDEEWKVMHRHTLEGEAMLQQVGGVLTDVGRVVRSSHEHYDGSGYPDGLAGQAIPLESRIVTACDAYSAMTTDRPYRRRRSAAAALEEMERCSGSQFDLAVVAALCEVLRNDPDFQASADRVDRDLVGSLDARALLAATKTSVDA